MTHTKFSHMKKHSIKSDLALYCVMVNNDYATRATTLILCLQPKQIIIKTIPITIKLKVKSSPQW